MFTLIDDLFAVLQGCIYIYIYIYIYTFIYVCIRIYICQGFIQGWNQLDSGNDQILCYCNDSISMSGKGLVKLFPSVKGGGGVCVRACVRACVCVCVCVCVCARAHGPVISQRHLIYVILTNIYLIQGAQSVL